MGGGFLQGVRSRWGRATLGVMFAAACAAALAAGVGGQALSDVLQVRLGGDFGETRVVVDLRQGVSGALGDVDPSQIDLVLKGASISAPMHGPGHGLVRGWSVTRAAEGARLTLDLVARAQVERRFLLPPADGVADYRYV